MFNINSWMCCQFIVFSIKIHKCADLFWASFCLEENIWNKKRKRVQSWICAEKPEGTGELWKCNKSHEKSQKNKLFSVCRSSGARRWHALSSGGTLRTLRWIARALRCLPPRRHCLRLCHSGRTRKRGSPRCCQSSPAKKRKMSGRRRFEIAQKKVELSVCPADIYKSNDLNV